MTFDAALARHEASPPPWSTACLSGVRVLVKDFRELFAPDVGRAARAHQEESAQLRMAADDIA
jgi:hypothetical protein